MRLALETGYRHIDTAEMYGNEKEVGEGIRAFGIDRDDVFVTSKLNNAAHRPDDARRAFDATLEALGTDHVDLFLIHWPLPTPLRRRLRLDLADVRGVLPRRPRPLDRRLQLHPHHLRRLAHETEVVPSVNQVEVHPFFTNDEVRAYGAEHGIATEAWSPIAQGAVLDDPTISTIADRVGRSTAQVTLRWHVQLGHIVFPKSVTRSASARTRRSSTSSSRRGHGPDQRPRQGRGGPDRAQPRHVRHGPRLTHGSLRRPAPRPGCRPSSSLGRAGFGRDLNSTASKPD